jgi:hypothetical protein
MDKTSLEMLIDKFTLFLKICHIGHVSALYRVCGETLAVIV